MNRNATQTTKYNFAPTAVLSGRLPSGKVSNEVRYQERDMVREVLRYGKISTEY